MKRFMLAIAFTCVLSVAALAGETPTGPPGETQTPPGEMQSPPGETQGPSILETVLLTIITWPR
jgi:hypothetical protein